MCPELASLTGALTNLWFLRFLTSRKELRQLSRMHLSSLLKIQGIGLHYAQIIQQWQAQAGFSSDVSWVGPMILSDAGRLLELLAQIDELEQQIVLVAEQSAMARRIHTIPGFGTICSSELAGEIGTLDRFEKEASLALYLGMTVLEKSSGKQQSTQPTRQINRRAKSAMMAAVAQHIRRVPESKVYYDKKRAEGKRHNQAVRALGRHLVMPSLVMPDRILKSEFENQNPDLEKRVPREIIERGILEKLFNWRCSWKEASFCDPTREQPAGIETDSKASGFSSSGKLRLEIPQRVFIPSRWRGAQFGEGIETGHRSRCT